MEPPFADLQDYRARHAAFTLPAPAHFNFGSDVVDHWAHCKPQHPALLWSGPSGPDRVLTYGEISRRSNRLARAFLRLGLPRGSRVLVLLPPVPEWWVTMTALCKADLIAIPATTLLTSGDLAYRLQAAEIAAVVSDAAGAAKIDAAAGSADLRARVLVGNDAGAGPWIPYTSLIAEESDDPPGLQTASGDPALIYFTSGTTGHPKMVLHSHVSYALGHRLTAAFWLALEPSDLHWNLSDPGWAKTAYSGYFGPWIAGCTVFVCHRPGKFRADDLLQTLRHRPVTTLCAPPTVYRMLVQEPLAGFQPAALRRCMAAGEPLNPAVSQKWQAATGLPIYEGYGQTETVILCASLPGLPIRPGSMGLPPPGIELAVLGDDSSPLPPDREGEIAVRVRPHRPVGLFQEYWRSPEATRRCFTGDWYRTGDCARIDRDGYFWFVGRADDIITSAAYRIGPFEVENALMQHPAVAETAVIGKPDPDRTEIVKAFVVLADGFQPGEDLARELQNHVKKTTAPYKYPREIEFLPELPKTVTGKIRRTELRARA